MVGVRTQQIACGDQLSVKGSHNSLEVSCIGSSVAARFWSRAILRQPEPFRWAAEQNACTWQYSCFQSLSRFASRDLTIVFFASPFAS